MTQTIAHTPTAFGPLAVLVSGIPATGIDLHVYPMESVAAARAEFPDAAAFVADTCCQDCGQDDRAARENTCESCGAPGCDCEVTEHPHGGLFCTACFPTCFCRDCEA